MDNRNTDQECVAIGMVGFCKETKLYSALGSSAAIEYTIFLAIDLPILALWLAVTYKLHSIIFVKNSNISSRNIEQAKLFQLYEVFFTE